MQKQVEELLIHPKVQGCDIEKLEKLNEDLKKIVSDYEVPITYEDDSDDYEDEEYY